VKLRKRLGDGHTSDGEPWSSALNFEDGQESAGDVYRAKLQPKKGHDFDRVPDLEAQSISVRGCIPFPVRLRQLCSTRPCRITRPGRLPLATQMERGLSDSGCSGRRGRRWVDSGLENGRRRLNCGVEVLWIYLQAGGASMY